VVIFVCVPSWSVDEFLKVRHLLWSIIVCVIFGAAFYGFVSVSFMFVRPKPQVMRDRLSAEELAFILHQVSVTSGQISMETLLDVFRKLDVYTAFRAQHTLRVMELLMLPPSFRESKEGQGKTAWTRLNKFEFMTDSIEQELEDNFAKLSTTQVVSQRTSVAHGITSWGI